MISTQVGTSIRRFRTDNARDYVNQYLRISSSKKACAWILLLDTPQQNGMLIEKRDIFSMSQDLSYITTMFQSIFWRKLF